LGICKNDGREKDLLSKNAKAYNEKGLEKLSMGHARRAEQLQTHIERLKELLFKINTD
jgi:hypothetical protein